ncbi:MAG: aldo/keto reductase [Acidobacteria bacterium]|nr:aldo/keto reductase [Acidobacteriota bacterium]
MTRPPLGRSGLGCVTFGREITQRESFAILDHAIAGGVHLFDTAEAYGDGASERILGDWLARNDCRCSVTLVTKVTTRFTHSHVREAIDASLTRLRSACVDIYLMHQYDAATPLEEALEAMTAVVESGRARFIGCSNFTAAQLRRAIEISVQRGLAPIAAIQPVYNLIARDIESEVLPLCKQENIAVMSYSPLAAGFLSGKYTPDRNALPAGSRFAIKPAHAGIYFHAENFRIVERLRALSGRSGIPITRLAMAWVMANPDIECVLAGARNSSQLDNALDAASNPLPAELIQEIQACIG